MHRAQPSAPSTFDVVNRVISDVNQMLGLETESRACDGEDSRIRLLVPMMVCASVTIAH